ncbi:MAG: glycosyltransferase family 1 protein [Candidatus Schekmanbacteria bacterium]|nr:MAG: glycosyltransferase family 1 protein [Candidatus Schekmanbacteria bacterium]
MNGFSKSLKILFVNEYFYPFEPGGAEKSAYLLAKGLTERGHKVYVLTPNYGAKKAESIDGIRVVRYPFPKKIESGERLRGIYTITPLFDIYMLYNLNKVIKDIQPDIIHSQNSLSLYASVKAGKRNRIPVVHTIRDYDLLCPSASCLMDDEKIPAWCGRKMLWKRCSLLVMPPNEKLAFFKKLRIRFNHQVHFSTAKIRNRKIKDLSCAFFVSRAIQNIYFSKLQLENLKSEIVYNLSGMNFEKNEEDIEKLKEKYALEDKKLILIPGNITYKKGSSIALNTAKKISMKRKDIKFIFAGRKEMQIEEDTEGIVFTGYLPFEELVDLYHLSYLVVCPSIYQEPFGRTAVEAMSCAVPVVASNVGGYREIIEDGVNGILFERRNEDELFNILIKLIDDADLRNRLAEECKRRIYEKFSSDSLINKTIELYQSLLSETNQR